MSATNTLTPREAARLLGTSLYFIYHQLWAGRIPGAKKVGKCWQIPMSTLRQRQLKGDKDAATRH
jgi:excisionase family DNA binding protein